LSCLGTERAGAAGEVELVRFLPADDELLSSRHNFVLTTSHSRLFVFEIAPTMRLFLFGEAQE
jgi:hypothetical protein